MTSDGKPSQDFIHKHMPDILNRLLTEIKGAPFVTKVSGSGKASKKAQGNDMTSGAGRLISAIFSIQRKRQERLLRRARLRQRRRKMTRRQKPKWTLRLPSTGQMGGLHVPAGGWMT